MLEQCCPECLKDSPLVVSKILSQQMFCPEVCLR
ncbi:MAG TPA: hypothetical protein EYQ15_04750 [Candidatus Poseidoniales archaeon]|nr:hypothetical protein [Candidatus Poseidoniales archaeon]HIL43906.1 hypothetical protein [Candidatus Poseidoniales archaeon]